jgi:hypothetical protein
MSSSFSIFDKVAVLFNVAHAEQDQITRMELPDGEN